MEKKQQKKNLWNIKMEEKAQQAKIGVNIIHFLILFEFSKLGVITETKIITLSHVVLNGCRKNI